MWMEETIGERVNVNRTREAVATGADQIAVGCPFCRLMLSDGLTEEQSAGRAREEVEVLDVAQLLLASVKGEAPVHKASSPKKAAVAAEPSAKDATQTGDTITDTADAGPAAKASGGGSLFDTPADTTTGEPAGTKPAEGGSLFDTPAPTAKATEAKPVPVVEPVETKTTEAKTETAGGSLFDFPSPGQQEATPSEKAQAEAVAEEEPVTSEPTNAPTAAEAKESTTAPTPGTEIGSGSLFDLTAPEGSPAEQASEAPPAEVVDEAPAEEPQAETPTPPETESQQRATDKKIPEDGSLFDL
jgi:hypothetical protein